MAPLGRMVSGESLVQTENPVTWGLRAFQEPPVMWDPRGRREILGLGQEAPQDRKDLQDPRDRLSDLIS